MKNKDFMNQTQLQIAQRISNAATEGNTEEFEAGIQALFENIQDNIIAQAAEMQGNADAAALAQRGVRVLTSQETAFYNTLIEAMNANNGDIKMALTDVDKTFPSTIITQVMEDMKQNHPLIEAVDTVNATGLMKFLLNTDEGDTAAWGALNEAIVKEITSGFKEIELGQFKLSAFMPISQDMLALGAAWLDNYIRTCLSEALALGYEKAIVSGTGKDQPIGMDRDIHEGVSVAGGVYPQKEAIAVTDFRPKSYGELVAKMAKNEKGKSRNVSGLIMVVNPTDYFKLVMPATTMLVPGGGYVNGVLPIPTQIIPSVAVAENEAILGMGKKYFLGIGGNRGIQFSDEYKFLEDQRYYKIVAYGNGRAKCNNDFLRLNIGSLEPLTYEVKSV